jgi:pimeloyl-ACP methyl ester carboxylesterase
MPRAAFRAGARGPAEAEGRSPGARLALLGAGAALGLGAISYLFGGLFVSWRLNRFPRAMRERFGMSPWELQVPAESLRLTTSDGVEIEAWHMPARTPDAPIVVALHGYRGERSEVLGISSYLWRRGFGVVIPDFRGRGSSQPGPISMGAWEVHDLAAVLEWLADTRPEVPVAIVGYSMGAAVALMEAGRHASVKAIVADCAYATQADVVSYGVERLVRLRGDFILPAAALFHRGYRRPGFDRVEPIAHAASWRGKALFFIGAEGDQTVSPGDSRRLFEVAPEPKALWVPKGAPHCGAYFQDRPRYCRLVAQFLEHHLGERASNDPASAAEEPAAGAALFGQA